MLFLRSDFKFEPASCYVDARYPCYKAVIPTEKSLAFLLPYLNATTRVIFYHPEEEVIVFRFEGKKVVVRSEEVQIGDLADVVEARKVKERLEAFFEDLWARKDEIEPRYGARELPTALEIYPLLPGTNCGRCGEVSCLAFAAKLATGEAELKGCSPLYEDKLFEASRRSLEAKWEK